MINMEAKIKHLEFIQNVITRMNSNSFLLKGWTVTVVSALLAFFSKNINIGFVMVSYFVIMIFWMLDGLYISLERRYRELYKDVASKSENEIDFMMDISKYNSGNITWCRGVFSTTIILFYIASICVTTIVMLLLFYINK